MSEDQSKVFASRAVIARERALAEKDEATRAIYERTATNYDTLVELSFLDRPRGDRII